MALTKPTGNMLTPIVGSSVATTSGTNTDFTSIPAGNASIQYEF